MVRDATEADAAALAELLTQLGYPTAPEQAARAPTTRRAALRERAVFLRAAAIGRDSGR